MRGVPSHSGPHTVECDRGRTNDTETAREREVLTAKAYMYVNAFM